MAFDWKTRAMSTTALGREVTGADLRKAGAAPGLKEAVEALMKADPFDAAGVFVRWTLRPWKMVFSNPRLMPTA